MEKTISVTRRFGDCVIIPNEFLCSKEITFFDKGLMALLLRIGEDFKVADIAREYNTSERKILKSLLRLIQAGYISRRPKVKNNRLNGQQYAFNYDLLF